MGKHTLRQMREEVQRELSKRSQVYPGLVRKGVMRQGEADEHTARMQSVREALEWLQEHEAELPDGFPWQRGLL